MVDNSIGSISKRKDNKYFLYLPKELAEDTGFPFKLRSSVKVKVSFTKENKLIVEELKD